MSGDHKKIEDWRYDQALKRTEEKRPDLLED
jgi:tRNA (guanine37-N1)-methyltransferase